MVINISKGIVFLLLFICNQSFSTHLRCGEILVTHVNGNTVDILIRVYTNTENTSTLFGGDSDILHFGDGQTMAIPEQPNTAVDGLHPSIRMASFLVRHTYNAPGKYLVSYSEANRNPSIVNIDNSVNTSFYLETSFTLDPFLGEFNSPEPFFHPIFYAYPDQPFSASIASTNGKGSEIHYTLTTPLQGRGQTVQNFVRPENFKVDKLTGLITWDNRLNGAYVTGEYLFAIRMELFENIDGVMVSTGYVYKDFQITLSDVPLEGGRLISDNIEDTSIDVFENDSRTFKVFASYLDGEQVEISLASELPDENISYTIYDSATATSNVKVTSVTVTTDASIVRNHPYIISIRNKFTPGIGELINDVNYAVYTEVYDPILAGEESLKRGVLTPNPVNDFVRFNGDSHGAAILEIMSMNGSSAASLLRGNLQNEWDLSSLKPGLYIVRVKDKAGRLIAIDKIIKR